MSKVGKKPIMIPEGVSIAIEGDLIKATGSKWSLELKMYPGVNIRQVDSSIELMAEWYEMRKFWWLMRALVQNMIIGVSEGYTKKMLVFGVGYTAKAHGENGIEFTLGLSHKVYHKIPAGVKIGFEKDVKNNDIITFYSIEKELIGETCARVRAIKPPEPYKGAGIRFLDEVIKLKPGKTASK